jgi:hypothetical protein
VEHPQAYHGAGRVDGHQRQQQSGSVHCLPWFCVLWICGLLNDSGNEKTVRDDNGSKQYLHSSGTRAPSVCVGFSFTTNSQAAGWMCAWLKSWQNTAMFIKCDNKEKMRQAAMV